MPDSEIIAAVRNKYQALRPVLDEKVRRRWAACEAMAIGWGGITWGVATIDLKTPECGHHILFLSQDLQNEGGNSHDDRTGRISARPPMGQARPWEYTYHSRGDGCLGCPVSPGGATRHFGRSGPGLTGRAGRFWSVVSAAGAALVVWAGARSGDDQS